MNLCGKYSLAQAAQSIAIADLIFSLGCLIVHVVEFTSDFDCKREWNTTTQEPLSTLYMSFFQIDRSQELMNAFMKNASTILCWIYVGIISANFILALVLWQAVMQESILKCVSYLLISWLIWAGGISVFIYHTAVVGKCPLYFALALYPTYWIYKIYALLVVKSFLSELRESPGQKRARIRRDYIQFEDSSERKDYHNRRSKITELINLGAQSYQLYKNKLFDRRKTFEFDEEQYTIEEKSLKIDHNRVLVSDELTATLKGTFILPNGNAVSVAVKTLKVTTPSIPHEKRLLEEAKFLAAIKSHENLLKVLGICRKQAKDKLFIVYESFGIGKLSSFLHDVREGLRSDFVFKSCVENGKIIFDNSVEGDSNEFSSFTLIWWAYRIASALDFLHEKKVLVGSISSKNFILTDLQTPKLCEFSLPHQKFPQKIYGRDELPSQFAWRWCSLECMESMDNVRFTRRSDVWSYAVMLWEVFTLGEVPYADWNCDIVVGLRKQLRLRKAAHIPDEIYDLMNTCWIEQPKERPSSKLLTLFLKQFVSAHKLLKYKHT